MSTLFDLEDQADEFLQAGAFEDAVTMAEAALAIDPKSLTALLVRAQAQKALGRVVDTVRDEGRPSRSFWWKRRRSLQLRWCLSCQAPARAMCLTSICCP